MTTLTISRLLRQARDGAVWRPSNRTLLLEHVVGRDRNRQAGLTDDQHLRAAAEWLERAQDATGNGGVAGRYRLRSGWTSAYPETTGYIVPTFLALADEPGGERFRGRAARAIEFLSSLQLPSGGFPGGELSDNQTEPSFFNTGQILAGLIAWHDETRDERVLSAARRAAEWLLSIQEADGAFRKHLYQGLVTTYGAHSSCWLAELGARTAEARYLDAARRHVDWVLAHADTRTGWIDKCGFGPSHHDARQAVTHTIAYTLWGVLATARIVRHTAAIAAVERAAAGIARRLELSGTLPGVLDSQWRPISSFSCLTGNAQMALVWFALYEMGGDSRFLNAALKAIDLVKRAQPMSSTNLGIRGGIPGSDPVWGDYIRMAVPNWSAKFFIDALLKKREVLSQLGARSRGLASFSPDRRDTLPPIAETAPLRDLRIVVLATPSSTKVARMLRTWKWGFRPSAVVLLSRPRRSAWQRLVERLKNDGLTARAGSTQRSTTASAAGGFVEARSACREAGIPILEVDSWENAESLDRIRELRPDLFVFAGGAILRAPLLAIPRLGTLNAHMGLLPFYRGMNVAEWACFHGDPVGCSVHLIDPGIDTGDIVCVRTVSVEDVRDVPSLRNRVDEAQMALLGEVVRYAATMGQLPHCRTQLPGEGRQFFRMHADLLHALERELKSGVHQSSRAAASVGAVSVVQ